jgi:hypothetical protein
LEGASTGVEVANADDIVLIWPAKVAYVILYAGQIKTILFISTLYSITSSLLQDKVGIRFADEFLKYFVFSSRTKNGTWVPFLTNFILCALNLYSLLYNLLFTVHWPLSTS